VAQIEFLAVSQYDYIAIKLRSVDRPNGREMRTPLDREKEGDVW
jgi:hypothetical protein